MSTPPDSLPAGLAWRKATFSIGNGACTETASSGGLVFVRDSAHPSSPVLTFTGRAWREFTARVAG